MFDIAAIIATLTLIFGVVVKVIGFPDQIRKNYTRKSTKGLSTTFIALSFTAYALWTIHGIIRDDPGSYNRTGTWNYNNWSDFISNLGLQEKFGLNLCQEESKPDSVHPDSIGVDCHLSKYRQISTLPRLYEVP